MQSILDLLQKYQHALQCIQQWFEDTGVLLEKVPCQVDLEKLPNCLNDLEKLIAKDQTVKSKVEEMQALILQMKDFLTPTVLKQMQTYFEESQRKATEILEQLKHRQNSFQR